MNTPIGIELPIKLGNQGYFQQTFDTTRSISNNVRMFFSVRQGEIPMRPTFGTRLFNVLFEQNSQDVEPIIQQTMLDEIEQWGFPITVLEINIDRSDNNIDTNRIGIEIKYVVNNDDANVQTMNLTI